MNSQKCRVCKVDKPLGLFVYANKGAKLTTLCKKCSADRARAYYYGTVRPNKCDLDRIAKKARDKRRREEARELGKARYKSEIACPKGHTGMRSVSGQSCCKCVRDKKLSEVSFSSKRSGVRRRTSENLSRTHYFTGVACKRGHVANRLVSTRQCVECLATRPPRNQSFVASEEARRRTAARRRTRVGRAKNRDYYRRLLKGKTSHRLTQFARACLRRCFTAKRDERTFELLGYTAEDLKTYLTPLMDGGMSWENYGEWHIDHIVPIAQMLSAGEYEPRVINALWNLRPLWAADNLSKGGAFIPGF